MSTTRDYRRTTDAPDSAAAQHAVKLLAKAEGYTVRTVKSVRLVAPPNQLTPARYTVTLAVVERALVPAEDCE